MPRLYRNAFTVVHSLYAFEIRGFSVAFNHCYFNDLKHKQVINYLVYFLPSVSLYFANLKKNLCIF